MSARYDDGFIAYLNGVEVARSNAPQNPRFDATALLERGLESAVIEELIGPLSVKGPMSWQCMLSMMQKSILPVLA